MRRRGVAAAPGDLDEAIAAFRRGREEGATQEERDIGDERLYELLVRRIHVEGHRADLDEVIELHKRDARRPNERPGEASVEEALRLRRRSRAPPSTLFWRTR